jgi:uncharacterized membrane protein YfcA
MPEFSPQMLFSAAGLAGVGALAGILAGLLGVGGGLVIVPALHLVFSLWGADPALVMQSAVGTSLATIVFTSLSSARAHWRREAVDARLLASWGPWIGLGAVAGAVLASRLDSRHLEAVFGVVAALAAIKMMLPGDGLVLADRMPARPFQYFAAGFIGLISALMGIGGGTLSVPVLAAWNTPIRRAVGTAAAFGFAIAVPGALGFVATGWDLPGRVPASLGFISLPGFALIVPASMACAPLGARLAHAVDPKKLRRIFGAVLLAVAARMLWKSL